MVGSTYIFIDGAYLLRRHAEIMRSWFDFEPDMDFGSAIRGLERLSGTSEVWIPVGGPPSIVDQDMRSFYYDCLDEDRRPSETDEDFAERLERQNARLRDLRDVNGCHIRLGALKGSKRRQQKEVDVLIAVDMMAHAARGNMDKAVLVTGDLDLRPAVEALVQLGISVQIVSEEKTTSRELTWAASSFSKLTFKNFYDWTQLAQRKGHPLPRQRNYLPNTGEILKEGSVKSDRCSLYQSGKEYVVYFPSFTADVVTDKQTFEHENLDKIELYFRIQYEPIVWDTIP